MIPLFAVISLELKTNILFFLLNLLQGHFRNLIKKIENY